MNYLKIINYDTNNGKFFRISIFLSGCGKVPKCYGCHNKAGWDFNAGFKYTQETEDYILKLLHQPLIKGFSILGGEPMDNLEDGQLLKLVKRIKTELPEMSIFCWTGYTYEEVINNKIIKEFLSYIDMLRDGEFILDQKDLNQYLQGSRNQRQVNVQESLKQGKIITF
jgi:anaerobic ribonucleoside-triphosphate reductase activating protein